MINEYEEKTKHPAGGWSALILLILLLLAGIAGAIIGFVLSDDYPALVALSVVCIIVIIVTCIMFALSLIHISEPTRP